MMTRSILSLVLLNLLSLRGLFAQNADSAWLVKNYTKLEVLVPMRDGVKLFTSIYTPQDNSQEHPILIVRTPYSVAPYGSAYSSRLYSTYWKNYTARGYVIVMQDVRGRYMSEGSFKDVRPFIRNKTGNQTDEASDAYDLIDWLVKNVKNNNGNVGVFGISYPGFYATMTAASAHPALKAASPQAPVTDWFMGDDFHHNGAFALLDGFSFYSGFGKPRPKPTTEHARGFVFPEKDNYNFFLKQGPVKNFKKLFSDTIAFWDDLTSHGSHDEFWKARDARQATDNLKPAMLVVGGTFDAEDCYGAWNLYKAIEKRSPQADNKLVMGPWFHGGWGKSEGSYLGTVRFGQRTSLFYQDSIELPFFEKHLNNKGEAGLAEATVFFTGENRWRRFNEWPPLQAESRDYYLRAGQQLLTEKSKIGDDMDAYISDPFKPVPYTEDVHAGRTREYMIDDQRFATRRPDVLVYMTEPLKEDLTLAGPVIADLKVVLSSTDADFVVKLIDVFPDDFVYDTAYCCQGVKNEAVMQGYQMLVRGEIMRGKFRNSFEKPEPFTPGKTETVKFTLPDVAHTFQKGHRMMVQVQSTWFPLFDRNPQTFTDIYTCDERAFVKSEIRILTNPDAASKITLPVLKK